MYREEKKQFEDLVASRLYCAKCKTSMPVKERLLLVLPDGYLFEYLCPKCGDSLGEKKTKLKVRDKLLF